MNKFLMILIIILSYFIPLSVYTTARNKFPEILFCLILLHFIRFKFISSHSFSHYIPSSHQCELWVSLSSEDSCFDAAHSSSMRTLQLQNWHIIIIQSFYIEHNFISRKLALRGFCYIWHEFWKIQYLLQQSKICSTKATTHVLLITFACSLLRKSRKTCRLRNTEIYHITGMRVLNEWAWTDNLQCVETGADVVVGSFTQCQQCVEVCFQLFLSHHLTTYITITMTVIITTKYQDQFSSAVLLLWPMKHRWNL